MQPEIIFALTTEEILRHSIVERGVMFYVPRLFAGPVKNALDFYEAAGVEVTDAGREQIDRCSDSPFKPSR